MFTSSQRIGVLPPGPAACQQSGKTYVQGACRVESCMRDWNTQSSLDTGDYSIVLVFSSLGPRRLYHRRHLTTLRHAAPEAMAAIRATRLGDREH